MSSTNSRLLQRLAADGHISAEQHEAVVNHMQGFGERVEEADDEADVAGLGSGEALEAGT